MLDMAWFAATSGVDDAAEIDRIKQRLTCDISQSLHRRKWSLGLSTFTTTSEVYSFAHDRLITDQEKFFLLGFPRSTRFDGLPSNCLKDLVGSAMALPALTVVMYSAALVLKLPGLWNN